MRATEADRIGDGVGGREELVGTVDVLSAFDFPPGTIAIPQGERIRYPSFVHCIATTKVPPGTQISMMTSVSLVENLNTIVRNRYGEWTWFQSDDHVWDTEECLLKLIKRDLPVVAPMMLKRSPPFVPVAFASQHEDGYSPVDWVDLPEPGGVIPVHACGSGGMLIQNWVWDRMEERQGHDRFFEYEDGEILNEDLILCRKIRDLVPEASPIWLDTDPGVAIGHRATITVWPSFSDGEWGVGFDMGQDVDGNRSTIFIPGHVKPAVDTKPDGAAS